MIVEFIAKIKLGNEAMRTGEDVARALRKMADGIEVYGEDFSERERSSGKIMDLNGNSVGQWRTKR